MHFGLYMYISTCDFLTVWVCYNRVLAVILAAPTVPDVHPVLRSETMKSATRVLTGKVSCCNPALESTLRAVTTINSAVNRVTDSSQHRYAGTPFFAHKLVTQY